MAHDPEMEQKIAAAGVGGPEVRCRRMFGGLCYLAGGNMAFGIYQDNLIVRLGDAGEAARLVSAGQALPLAITGRVMQGWVMVPKGRLLSLADYRGWLEKGLACARSLPAKG
ncbi:MAG: TfoX/Sxy family protein [Thermodesulfobacteriota bacterium]